MCVRAGKSSARVTTRARILDRRRLVRSPGGGSPGFSQALGTVYRIKRRFAEAGLEGVLQDRPQAQRYRKLDDRGEAHLIAGLQPSAGGWQRDHWTLRVGGQVLVGVGVHPPALSAETVRQRLRPQAVAEAGMVHPAPTPH